MSKKLQQLLESSNEYKNLRRETSKLVNKWKQTRLLSGLKDHEAHAMALMLENQAKQLFTEASVSGGTGTFTAGTGEQWAGVALPLVRKIFGQISSKEFLSVQPMNLPSGLVFFLDFQYGTTKSPFAAGDSMYGNTGDNTPFGNTDNGGLYGAGRFGYSINNTSSITTITATGSANFYSDLNADGFYSSSLSSYKTYRISTGSLGANWDTEAVRGFYLTSSNISPSNIIPEFTKVTGSTIQFVATADLAVPTDGVTASFTLQPTDASRGDFEDKNTALNANNDPISIPEINVKMKSEGIIAKTRKLKSVWTPEFAQDLNAYQSLDAEAELTSIMSEYISLEIDLELLSMLISSVPTQTTEYWSAENNVAINSTGVTNSDLGFFNTQGGWFQTLGTKMQKVSNKIHQLTLRGGANFLVCSPDVGTVLESIPGFASNSDGDVSKTKYAFGVMKAGTINSRYDVYKNPYMKENTILMGFRGSQFLESGAVFSPYIPLIMTPLVYDPETFTPRKGLLTRYAKKMLRPEFYGKVFVSGLNTL